MLRQCLSNQHDKAMELQQLRLQHVKIRNASADLQTTLRAMDRIGDKYTLVEFEQLKMENRTHLDKVEERDEELSKLRKRCHMANQGLAHIREKCSAIEIQIRKLSTTLTDCEDLRIRAREEVNQLKQRRDYYRNETHRLKLSSGLLTKDKLLLDMENTIKEIKSLEIEMQQKNSLFVKLENKVKNMKSAFEKESKKPKYKRQLSSLPKKRGIRLALR
ncbi:PREDICTED: coiled-coil domain-containing protein 96-like [Nicrophorus vespilloides]|uniref:Coiled-coil domain-containing protein 96-like n=1 Tax=Nicrophorus vespilloides TaxID=110193 RepID=A0ABM1MJ60_NICVS|nr:PREDICTED: coiled-coil domain-containing protein 96-like [Nicrophorus vespilloides]